MKALKALLEQVPWSEQAPNASQLWAYWELLQMTVILKAVVSRSDHSKWDHCGRRQALRMEAALRPVVKLLWACWAQMLELAGLPGSQVSQMALALLAPELADALGELGSLHHCSCMIGIWPVATWGL